MGTAEHLAYCGERERAYSGIDGIVGVGEVIEAGHLWQTNERHDVTRIGERATIASHVRAAVWYRDRGLCADCPADRPSGDPLHLDHIQPWSNGGADTTDNLRLLCERHNLRRSNYVDFARPKRPATWWCLNCYSLDEHVWERLAGPWITCSTHGRYSTPAKSRCRVVRRYWQEWERDESEASWHEIPMLEGGDRIAYCAHCDAPGLTAVVL